MKTTENQSPKAREYSFADFGKVLLHCLKMALICMAIVAVTVSVGLSLFSVLVTHDEYSASIAKVKTSSSSTSTQTPTYDVPIIRATLKDRFRIILADMYKDKQLTDKQLTELSREVDEHLHLKEEVNGEGVYEFKLTSFKSDIIQRDDFGKILDALISYYRNQYVNRIVASYTIESNPETDPLLINMDSSNYYLQAELLLSYLETTVEEIETIAGLNVITTDTNNSSAITATRSEFAAALPKEFTKTGFEPLYTEVYSLQGYITENKVEKEGTAPMDTYVAGRLLNEPDNQKWQKLQDTFDPIPVYEATKAAEVENKIDGIITKINEKLNDYNEFAGSFASSTVENYAIISTLIEEDEDVGAFNAFIIVILTVASTLIAFLVCYLVQFSKMQKNGTIGTIADDEEKIEN